ncbi:Uu.00g043500.m01.CDS01 [Anthostomella pinea]|uniref:Uu.00g043500.m01.CDS01 n=1 Tax=Anthostomella pinea TaxID=933095 RepID=A0AAI8YE86_9PEZI|nr:Uu.00g043500.m01.CDS01 [Anthostomella pinea]
MWDRLRQKDAGSPLNRKKLEAWQNARSSQSTSSLTTEGIKGGNRQYQYAIKGGRQTPPRPLRDMDRTSEHNQTYLSAPPVQPPPSTRNNHRSSSYGRPVSSIYSQPSPEAATFAAHQLRNEVGRINPSEVSPPSSPDIASTRHGPNPGDVSPIDEISDPVMSQHALERHAPPKNNARSSNIPMMRRQRRKNSDAAQNALRSTASRENLRQPRPHGSDVRWDPATGEPTSSTKGRPSQVNPQQYAQGLGTRATSTSPQTKPAQQSPNSFGERVRRTRQASGSPQPEPAPRPEWRGASGRTTIVAPVSDSMNVAPLSLPSKNSKRPGPGPGMLSPVESGLSETSSPQVSVRGQGMEGRSGSTEPSSARPLRRMNPSEQQPHPSHTANATSTPHPSAYPSPPLSDDISVPAKLVPAQHQPHPSSSAQASPRSLSLQVPSNDKAIRRKPAAGASHQPDNSTSPSPNSPRDIHPSQAPPGSFPSEWTQPPSRFSVTTYATSNYTSTPRESVDEETPPVPTSSQRFAQPPKPASGSSVLDRKRPVVKGFERSSRTNSNEPVKINMDSPYYVTSSVTKPRHSSPRTVPVPRGNDSTLSFISVSSTEKSLPPAPPEVTAAQDRVAQLNAKLEALGNRRININTAIKQMTELMPTDNILASDAVVRKREDEKRKVEVLRGELADVERESYELGLKLHRAYKRLDRDAEYEPTGLWVRRVTG